MDAKVFVEQEIIKIISWKFQISAINNMKQISSNGGVRLRIRFTDVFLT